MIICFEYGEWRFFESVIEIAPAKLARENLPAKIATWRVLLNLKFEDSWRKVHNTFTGAFFRLSLVGNN